MGRQNDSEGIGLGSIQFERIDGFAKNHSERANLTILGFLILRGKDFKAHSGSSIYVTASILGLGIPVDGGVA